MAINLAQTLAQKFKIFRQIAFNLKNKFFNIFSPQFSLIDVIFSLY